MGDNNHKSNEDKNHTSSALLEQLVYIDNFMNKATDSSSDMTPNLDIDGQLSIDLAAFVDDSFVFPDEEKPQMPSESPNNDFNEQKDNFHNINDLNRTPKVDDFGISTPQVQSSQIQSSYNQQNINISALPKFPVPPGAKSSLESVGLSQKQIDLLSALVAHHQMGDLNRLETTSKDNRLHSPVRQHNHIRTGSQSGSNLISSISSFDLNHTNNVVHDSRYSHEEGIQNISQSTFTHGQLQSLSHDTMEPHQSLQLEESKEVSELDKRRRNTAASARFRIKKKLKEKQMENQIMNLNETIKNYEAKIQNLDMENKLLKNLIMEKGTQKSDHELRLLKERAKLG